MSNSKQEKKEINVRVGQNIQNCRLLANLTQEQLAEALDFTSDHISKIERGKSGVNAEIMEKICEILGVTPDILFYGSKNLTSEDLINEKVHHLSPEHRELLFRIIDTYIESTKIKE